MDKVQVPATGRYWVTAEAPPALQTECPTWKVISQNDRRCVTNVQLALPPGFRDLRSKNAKGLIVYLTAGDPNLDATGELLLALDRAGVDVIELGVPFSDPLADGPVIQRASERALRSGTTLRNILERLPSLAQDRARSHYPV